MSQKDSTEELPKIPKNPEQPENAQAKKPASRGWSSPAAEEENKYLKSLQTLLGPKQAGPEAKRKKPGKDPDTLLYEAAGSGVQGVDVGSDSKVDKAALVFIGCVIAALIVVLGITYLVFFRDGDSGAAQEGRERGQAQQQAQQQPQAPSQGDSAVPELGAIEPEPTGIVFQKPRVNGDKYSLTVGDYTWSGKVFTTENSKQWVLEGTTAAHFTRAVDLPDEDGDGKKDWITTGVFGRAEPGQPILHATFQRTRVAEKQQTTGTYQLIDSGEVALEGTYTDRVTKDNPKDQPDKIVRYYMQSPPGAPPDEATVEAYEYKAHPNALIPGLVGWEAPAGEEGDAGGNQEGAGEMGGDQ